MNCPKCSSTNVIKKGFDTATGLKQRYKCKDCDTPFQDMVSNPTTVNLTDFTSKTNKWVITSVINDSIINENFLNSLLNYCSINNAELLLVPIKYKSNFGSFSWDTRISKYFIDKNVELTKDLKLLADMHITATVINPLSGLDRISKGSSLIIPHPQLQMKCIAVDHVTESAILHTTGTISFPEYSKTKTGEKAIQNHTFSALIVEEDSEIESFHIRVLEADDTGGFQDLDRYYTGNITFKNSISAIVLGDEHVSNIDKVVSNATFWNSDCIVDTLKPYYIIRHDILDFYSANHHHKHNYLLQYKKFMTGENLVEDELRETIEHIINTTPKYSNSIIVASNHNDALTRWLNESNPKSEPWNSKLYHQLMYLKLKEIEDNLDFNKELSIPFELWSKFNYDIDNIVFLKRNDSFKINGIEVALHSDKGVNGSKGSIEQFGNLGVKTIIGHSHTPGINNNCYQVGTNSKLKLEYNNLSTWRHADCIIHKNGTRQIIFINKGKWRV